MGDNIHGECVARAYIRELGALPPSGVQGQRPWSGSQGWAPEADEISALRTLIFPYKLHQILLNRFIDSLIVYNMNDLLRFILVVKLKEMF
jgi:hypothetical protein